jgi:hypothetical protein
VPGSCVTAGAASGMPEDVTVGAGDVAAEDGPREASGTGAASGRHASSGLTTNASDPVERILMRAPK